MLQPESSAGEPADSASTYSDTRLLPRLVLSDHRLALHGPIVRPLEGVGDSVLRRHRLATYSQSWRATQLPLK